MGWVPWILGLRDGNDWPYLFWSGIGWVIAPIAAFMHLRNCQTRWCWRMGHYELDVNGVAHRLCRKHHPHLPDRPPTADQIAEQAQQGGEQC